MCRENGRKGNRRPQYVLILVLLRYRLQYGLSQRVFAPDMSHPLDNAYPTLAANQRKAPGIYFTPGGWSATMKPSCLSFQADLWNMLPTLGMICWVRTDAFNGHRRPIGTAVNSLMRQAFRTAPARATLYTRIVCTIWCVWTAWSMDRWGPTSIRM